MNIPNNAVEGKLPQNKKPISLSWIMDKLTEKVMHARMTEEIYLFFLIDA